MKYKNLTIKEQDIKIIRLLSKIKIIKSSTLYNLVKIKETKYGFKYFLRRIKQLKDNGYIKDVKGDMRGEQILSLTNNKSKLIEIENLIGAKIYKGNINTSNSLFTHEGYISKALLYLKKNIKQKLDVNNFISQYYIYNIINSNTNLLDKNLLKQIMINDGMINLNNTSLLLEVEVNALNKAKAKFEGYKKMEIFYDKIKEKYPFFKDNIILFIFCHGYKLEKYKKIINNIGFKRIKVYYIEFEKLNIIYKNNI